MNKNNYKYLFSCVIIGFIILFKFNFFLIFSVSSNSILRAFSTDKVILYFNCMMFLLTAKSIVKAPYFKSFILFIVAVLMSDFFSDSIGLITIKQVNMVLFFLFMTFLISKENYFEKYIHWNQKFFIVIVLVSLFSNNLLEVLISNSEAGISHKTMVEGQATAIGDIDTSSNPRLSRRSTLLWFDSNNFAYLLVTSIIFLICKILLTALKARDKIIHLLFLITLFWLLLSTFSRGGMLTCLISVMSLLILLGKKKIMINLFILFLSLVMLSNLFMPSFNHYLGIFNQSYQKGLAIFAPEKTTQIAGGRELPRIVAAYVAFKEFIEKPIFGWGSSKVGGEIGFTANHLGYLEILVKYGLFGFFILIHIVYKSFKKFYVYRRHMLKTKTREHAFLWFFTISMSIGLLVSGLFRSIDLLYIAACFISFDLFIKSTMKLDVN